MLTNVFTIGNTLVLRPAVRRKRQTKQNKLEAGLH